MTSADGLVLEVVDKGIDGWQIVDPALGAADAEQVYTLVSSLMGLEVEATLDPAPTAAEMGLDCQLTPFSSPGQIKRCRCWRWGMPRQPAAVTMPGWMVELRG